MLYKSDCFVKHLNDEVSESKFKVVKEKSYKVSCSFPTNYLKSLIYSI